MRPIIIVFLVALVAIVLGITLSPKGRGPLVENPSEVAAEQQEAEQRAEMARSAAVNKPAPSESFAAPREGVITAVMSVPNRGEVTIELYPKAAPKTVARFTQLIKSGFYNGIKFHRVVQGFVAQAGDPKSKSVSSDQLAKMSEQDTAAAGLGAGGSGQSIPFEKNSLQHVPGTVAMALSAPRSNTADSQFFINLVSNHSLDGDYCVFGKVTQGMDVVQKIQQGDVIGNFVVR